MQTAYRTHTCGELRLEHAGQHVTLCGWVQTTRDLGKFAFLVLRDRFGRTQATVSAADQPGPYEQLTQLGRETVVQLSGPVVERESKNPEMPTGDIEIQLAELQVLSPAAVPPFLIERATDGQEDLRLQYRYLDLRRPNMTENLVLRSRMVRAMRDYLDGQQFLEIETPVMIKSTPEGARDFLVPSRMHPGNFYALAQSPQLLKQLLMVGGMDRYYQLTKCFRDEDFRGDRQPEFSQLDCEMAFAGQEDILQLFGGLVRYVFQQILSYELPNPLPRYSYEYVMARYGSDKPDLRFGCELVELNETVRGSGFKVFDEPVNSGGKVIGIPAPGCAGYSRKQIDALTELAKAHGLKGLAWIKLAEDGSIKSSIDKFFGEEQLRRMGQEVGATAGDLVLIAAGPKRTTQEAAGALRLQLGQQEGWIDTSQWSVFFVVDFPLFEPDEATGELYPMHHPFVMPHRADLDRLESDPASVRAECYDLVINGAEIMSGSVRIHDRTIQQRIFNILQMSEQEQEEKFGFLLEAFRYGAPPHAGCAFGLDRWVMLFAGGDSLRDIIAFPKTTNGRDAMLGAPSPAAQAQLQELGLALDR
jgi:aspartyl-tRNA synthetase